MIPPNKIHLQRIFNKLDKNDDGVVSVEELMWLLERIGFHANQDEVELLVGKNTLDYIEFSYFYETLMTTGNIVNESYSYDDVEQEDEIFEMDLRNAFRVFDLNGDGYICCIELKLVLSKLGLWDDEQDCTKMIGLYDTNSDGLLDFEEFKNMMLVTDQSSCN